MSDFFGLNTKNSKVNYNHKQFDEDPGYGVVLDDHLFEDDALNDETFGGPIGNLQEDYDFASGNQMFMGMMPNHGPVNNGQVKRAPPGFVNNPQLFNHPMNNQNNPYFNEPTSEFGVSIDLDDLFAASAEPESETIDWEKIRLERKLAREKRHAKMEREANFMCQNDKDFILRVQLSQLVYANDNLKVDDFYFEMYNSTNSKQLIQSQVQAQGSLLPSTKEQKDGNSKNQKNNELQKMQKQLAKVVADTKRRAEKNSKGIENALGRIPLKSTTKPKQVLQVSHQKNGSDGSNIGLDVLNSSSPPSGHQRIPSGARIPGISYRPALAIQTPLEKKKTALTIENMYGYLLEAEQLARNRPIMKFGSNEERTMLAEWARRFEGVCIDLWNTFGIANDKNPSSIVHFLNSAKGKKLILRYGRLMSRDHSLNFITVLLSHLEYLNVCKNGFYPPKGRLPAPVSEEIELFLSSVLPLVISYVNDAPLVIVNGLLSLVMEKNNVVALSRCKVGLAFLTLLLTRIEVLRESGSSMVGMMAPSPDIPLAQSTKLYTALFDTLQQHFLAMFPPTATPTSNEDFYVWQFLAMVAVGINDEQRHTIVLRLRDKVVDVISHTKHSTTLTADMKASRIATVNLFLHALQLDASQVNV